MTKIIIMKTIGIDELRYHDNEYYDILLLRDNHLIHYTFDDEDTYKECMKQIEYNLSPLHIKRTSNKFIYNMLRLLTSSYRNNDIIKFQLAFNLI